MEKPAHVHELLATIYLMGIDREMLTYRYSGRDFRLTDVHGMVILDIAKASWLVGVRDPNREDRGAIAADDPQRKTYTAPLKVEATNKPCWASSRRLPTKPSER